MELKRVVVTGMGITTPLGHSLEDYWQNLICDKNGISFITLFDTTDFTTKIAGEIKDLNVEDYIDKKDARRMDRFTHFSLISAKLAVKYSGLDFAKEDMDKFGVIAASGIGGRAVFERECQVLLEKGPRRVSPFLIPMLIADIAPGYISIEFGLKGCNY